MFKKRWIIFLCFLLLSVSVFGFKFNKKIVNANVSRRKVKTGQIFNYIARIEGVFFQPKLIMPKFKDFKIVSQTEAKSYSLENGKVKTRIKLIYKIFAPQAGVFIIEPIVLKDKKNKHKSKSIKIKVKGKSLLDKKSLAPYIIHGTKL